VSNRTFGALLQGIDPARERVTSTLSEVITEGEFLAADDLDGALVGETLARNLGVQLGDELVFIGQGADGSMAAGKLYVRGLFKTGIAELDRNAAAAHIDTLGEAFSLYGAVTEIAILLDQDRDRPEAVGALNAALQGAGRNHSAEVLEWPTLMPGVEESIKMDWYSGQIIYAVLVLVVGFGIANTFLMAYLERIHEFGVLLSLGMRPRKLSFLVYAESALLTLIGVVVGVALGTPLVMWTHRTGIYFGEGTEEIMAEYGMSPLIHPILIPIIYQYSIIIVLTISLLLALYPAVKAARLKPVEALRHR
jgi:ABC-type lipoprotein release transport system permease subunit